jgi:hypothetical protein
MVWGVKAGNQKGVAKGAMRLAFLERVGNVFFYKFFIVWTLAH